MQDERPPLFGTWGRLYGAVLAYVVCVIALFDWFTRSVNR